MHTRTPLPIILAKKLIQLCLPIAGMDAATLKRPIALLAPMCAATPGTGQFLRFTKVYNIHGRCFVAAMTVRDSPQL